MFLQGLDIWSLLQRHALNLRVGKKSKFEHLHGGLKLKPARDCKWKISSRPNTDRYPHTTENWSTEQAQLGESKGLHVKCCLDSIPMHWNKKWTGEFQESHVLFLTEATCSLFSRHPSLHTHFSIWLVLDFRTAAIFQFSSTSLEPHLYARNKLFGVL